MVVSGRGRGILTAALLLAAGWPLLPTPDGAWTADATTSGPAGIVQRLPSARESTSAAWTGSHAYIFGGFDGKPPQHLGGILRYDPATNALEKMRARLDPPRAGASSVWTGTHAYLFGGEAPASRLRDIVRYDPANDTLEVMPESLPIELAYSSAVWDGRFAYLFGGHCGEGCARGVHRYDPANGTVTEVVTVLPGGNRFRTAAAWDSEAEAAYIVGGQDSLGRLYADILRFRPGEAPVLVASLPKGLQHPAAVWTGRSVLVLGGGAGAAGGTTAVASDEVVQFMPGRPPWVRAARLAVATCCASAVWDGRDAYVFGGGGTDRVERYVARPVAAMAPVPDAECVDGKAEAELDGSSSFDPEGVPLSFHWSASGSTLGDASAARTRGTFPFGNTALTLTVRSDGPAEATGTVRVVDTKPPAISVTRPREGTMYVLDEVKLPHGKYHDKDLPAVAVGPLTVMAQASDRCGLVHVGFLASDGEQAVVPAPGVNYTFLLDPAAGHAGALAVEAMALDLGGHTTTATTTHLHVGTNPMPRAMAACTFLFRASDCADLRVFIDSVLAGVRPPQGAEDLCRLLLGGTVCDEFTGK